VSAQVGASRRSPRSRPGSGVRAAVDLLCVREYEESLQDLGHLHVARGMEHRVERVNAWVLLAP